MSQKVSCNTSVDKDLLAEAKSLNVKLSAIFESALTDAVRAEKRKKWLAENADAIQAHNQLVAEQGTFSEQTGQLK